MFQCSFRNSFLHECFRQCRSNFMPLSLAELLLPNGRGCAAAAASYPANTRPPAAQSSGYASGSSADTPFCRSCRFVVQASVRAYVLFESLLIPLSRSASTPLPFPDDWQTSTHNGRGCAAAPSVNSSSSRRPHNPVVMSRRECRASVVVLGPHEA